MPRQPTPFVILATQRTGSSWVRCMLESHEAVDTFREIFDRDAQAPRYFTPYLRRHTTRRNAFTRARLCFPYLDELYAGTSSFDAIGFKLMYVHLKEQPAVVPYIGLRRVRVVHLVRTNLLDVVISDDTARARGQFHARGSDPAPVTVSLDPMTLVGRLDVLDKRVRMVRRLLAVTRTPSIEVSYEGLVADPRRFADILRFLSVRDPDQTLTCGLRKLNTLSKPQIISNYREIEDQLRGTRFAGFLQ